MPFDSSLREMPGVCSSATVHEAAGRVGALPHRIRPAYVGATVVGPAYPVLCPAGDNLWLHHAIYSAAPGDVLVVAIDRPQDVEFGYWGEVMAVAAQARGIAGLVIDGGVRDSVELAELDFPVFAAAIAIRGTIKDPNAPGSLGSPVHIADVRVSAGDLVVGDADGVVSIPHPEIGAVAAASAHRVERELHVMSELRAGGSTVDLFGLPSHTTVGLD